MTSSTRRHFGLTAGYAFASLAFGEACLTATKSAAIDARLLARPVDDAATTLTSGAIGLGANGRDGVIQMPTTPRTGRLPLLLFFTARRRMERGCCAVSAPLRTTPALSSFVLTHAARRGTRLAANSARTSTI